MAEKKYKVLLVEDDEYLVSIYATKFELEGFGVIKAADGVAGLKAAENELPDLILAYILMPKMNGFELLQELKKNPKTKKIPVVILSNLGQKEDIEKGLKLGAADYIIKVHLTPTEIFERVTKLIK